MASKVSPGLWTDTFNNIKYVFKRVEDTPGSNGEWDIYVLDNSSDSDRLELLDDGDYYTWSSREFSKKDAIEFAMDNSKDN